MARTPCGIPGPGSDSTAATPIQTLQDSGQNHVTATYFPMCVVVRIRGAVCNGFPHCTPDDGAWSRGGDDGVIVSALRALRALLSNKRSQQPLDPHLGAVGRQRVSASSPPSQAEPSAAKRRPAGEADACPDFCSRVITTTILLSTTVYHPHVLPPPHTHPLITAAWGWAWLGHPPR